MKYTHTTVDVGAAEKYCKGIWINPDDFKDVISMISCIFLVTVENLSVTVGLRKAYISQECVQ